MKWGARHCIDIHRVVDRKKVTLIRLVAYMTVARLEIVLRSTHLGCFRSVHLTFLSLRIVPGSVLLSRQEGGMLRWAVFSVRDVAVSCSVSETVWIACPCGEIHTI